MVKVCGGGDEKKEKKCMEDGVSLKDCTKVFGEKFKPFIAKFLCNVHDIYQPHVSKDGGLS
jgi:hypothetical protein